MVVSTRADGKLSRAAAARAARGAASCSRYRSSKSRAQPGASTATSKPAARSTAPILRSARTSTAATSPMRCSTSAGRRSGRRWFSSTMKSTHRGFRGPPSGAMRLTDRQPSACRLGAPASAGWTQPALYGRGPVGPPTSWPFFIAARHAAWLHHGDPRPTPNFRSAAAPVGSRC